MTSALVPCFLANSKKSAPVARLIAAISQRAAINVAHLPQLVSHNSLTVNFSHSNLWVRVRRAPTSAVATTGPFPELVFFDNHHGRLAAAAALADDRDEDPCNAKYGREDSVGNLELFGRVGDV